MIHELKVKTIRSINQIDSLSWNALTGSEYPFLRHEFLNALESNDCLGKKTGWIPHHLVFFTAKNELAGALPMYLKFNSFGEFVFDWSWADAYSRAGLAYYPKLVIASPFTPATGPRILMSPKYAGIELFRTIMDSTIAYADQYGVSSAHWLFTSPWEGQNTPKLLQRIGCQFHWENKEYECFDDFLARMTSKKRKQIKKERRLAGDSGVRIRLVPGHQMDLDEWRSFHDLYRSTFIKHGNYPALTLGFFEQLGQSMGNQVLVALAYMRDDIIAAAFFLVGNDTLYGRYWGCNKDIPGLHFETCYYQGLEYCIEKGLKRFEPGAQGEHKISRGFLPASTQSLHWIKHSNFRAAIADFVNRDNEYMLRYIESLKLHSPFKK